MNAFVGQYPGTVGTRGILRGPSFFNTDLAVSKSFRLPWEGQRVAFRAEAFNAFNNVQFGNPNTTTGLSLANPGTFGEIYRLRRGHAGTSTTVGTQAGPRVMQLALRYEF